MSVVARISTTSVAYMHIVHECRIFLLWMVSFESAWLKTDVNIIIWKRRCTDVLRCLNDRISYVITNSCVLCEQQQIVSGEKISTIEHNCVGTYIILYYYLYVYIYKYRMEYKIIYTLVDISFDNIHGIQNRLINPIANIYRINRHIAIIISCAYIHYIYIYITPR